MERFTGREDQAAPTCLFRRVLVLLGSAEVDLITTAFIQARLAMLEREVASLVQRLLSQKVVTETSAGLLINKEALKDAKRRFLAIKSNDTKSTSVTRTSSSKRKEEEMTAREAVMESRKKKKSRTASDLQC